MTSIRTKLSKYLSKYVSVKMVMYMDLLISLLSSVVIFFLLNYFTNNSYRGQFFYVWMGSSLLGTCIAMFALKSYTNIIRHLGIRDILGFVVDTLIKGAVMFVAAWFAVGLNTGPIVLIIGDCLLTFAAVVLVRIAMIVTYDAYRSKAKDIRVHKRTLIYGTSDKAAAAYFQLFGSSAYNVVGFISNADYSGSMKLNDLHVYHRGSDDDMKGLLEDNSISAVLFVSEDDARKEREGLVSLCAANGVQCLITQSTTSEAGEVPQKRQIRDVKIEDLLGRDEIKISMDAIKANFSNKVIMVTGAAGSIGSELCRQLATIGVKKLVLYDNAETPLHNIRLELEEKFPNLDFAPIIGDVRHVERLDYVFRREHPQVVFHAAAYKHVPLMEENPCEAVIVNVLGSRRVAEKCLEYGVEKMVMISTDKAVNPTNIMGCSKRLAEIFVQGLGLAIENGSKQGATRFVTTRFGNVLGSNGSVIPRFREQIAKGGPVTVTHPDITRFFMTIPEACRLVMEAATMSKGNEIFVFDMGESVKIDSLARNMIRLAGFKPDVDIEIKYTGLRPGEKLYEEVLSDKENTLPTSHERIRIAKVRDYEYDLIDKVSMDLTKLAIDVNIPELVKLMKKTVPEFISKHSEFEKYDVRS